MGRFKVKLTKDQLDLFNDGNCVSSGNITIHSIPQYLIQTVLSNTSNKVLQEYSDYKSLTEEEKDMVSHIIPVVTTNKEFLSLDSKRV